MKKFLLSCLLALSAVGASAQTTRHFPAIETDNTFQGNNVFSLPAKLGPVNFSSLPGNSAGKVVFCADCQAVNPCASGGTGALATNDGSSWSCSTGGNNNGVVLIQPSASQTINQKFTSGARTGLNVNIENGTVILNTSDTSLNWSQSPSGSLTAGSRTITLSPCPKGLSTKDHKVYLAGTGTPEIAPITAFSCVPDATSGTITVTVANSHTAGYTAGTTSTGLKEASEYIKNTGTLPATITGGKVVVAAGSILTLRGTTYIEALGQTIDFNNAEVDVYSDAATYTCALHIGSIGGAGGGQNGNVNLRNLTGFKPMVPAAGALCLNSQGTTIDTLSWLPPNTGNYWDPMVTVLNDQSAHIVNFQNINNGSSSTGVCTAAHCPVIISGPGGVANAGLLHVNNLQLTLSNKYNAIDNQNQNGLVIDFCVLQNLAQFGIRSKGGFPNTLNLSNPICYFESVGGANPKGLGGAAYILQNGQSNTGIGNITGTLPLYANTGGTSYYYFIHPKDSSGNPGPVLMSGYATLTTTGLLNVNWYDISPGGTYTVLRVAGNGSSTVAPTTSNCGGGSVPACGYVALNLAEGTVCDPTTLICTFQDNIANSTTAFTVPTQTFHPSIDFWPGLIVASVPSGGSLSSGAAKVHMQVAPAVNAISGGLVAGSGTVQPEFFADYCPSSFNWSSMSLTCSTFPNNANGAMWIRAAQNGTGGKTGAINMSTEPGVAMQSGDFISFIVADKQVLFATPLMKIPQAAGDTAIGYETAGSGGLVLRDGNSIRLYINSIPANAPLFKLTATSATFSSAIALTLGNITGSTQCLHVNSAGLVTGTGSDCGSGGGGGGTGTVTSVATSSPIVGGTFTTAGTISCPTCAVTGTGLGQFAATTSATLRGILSDESGTGFAVFQGGALGAATATSINKIAFTQPATGATLALIDGKTLTVNNTINLSGSDGVTGDITSLNFRTCEIIIGDPGAASSVLTNDNDEPAVCVNSASSTLSITAVKCFADAGSPTVNPIITGGSSTSILSSALTCGTGSYATGTLNGSPTQTTAQTIDGNITVAGGTAKYIVIRITRTF